MDARPKRIDSHESRQVGGKSRCFCPATLLLLFFPFLSTPAVFVRTQYVVVVIRRLFCGDVNGRCRCFAFFLSAIISLANLMRSGGEAIYEIGIKTSPPVAANFAAHKLVDLP